MVIGGGFAGLSAAERFSWEGREHEVVLIDVRDSSHFLPLLPDIIGKSLSPEILTYSLNYAARRWNFRFKQTSVQALNLSSKYVITDKGEESFDLLLIATGSETDFRTYEAWRSESLTLENIEDAVRIRNLVISNEHNHYIVSGGGYTGVEIASNIQHLIRSQGQSQQVTLVGRAETLCPSLPVEQRLYLADQIRKSGIEIRSSTTVLTMENGQVYLSDGSNFSQAALIWAAGVCTPSFVRNLPLPMNRHGRLRVDPFLSVGDCIFAAGDTANFSENGEYLRMCVQFSLEQGWHAAGNILRRLNGKSLSPYRPFDPGWVVPLANRRGCGNFLRLPVFGRLPALLHYFMSVVRSKGFNNRLKLIRHLLDL